MIRSCENCFNQCLASEWKNCGPVGYKLWQPDYETLSKMLEAMVKYVSGSCVVCPDGACKNDGKNCEEAIKKHFERLV